MRKPKPAELVAFLVYPRREGPDVSVVLEPTSEPPSTLAVTSASQSRPALDVFSLYDQSDAPRFITYVYRGTVPGVA